MSYVAPMKTIIATLLSLCSIVAICQELQAQNTLPVIGALKWKLESHDGIESFEEFALASKANLLFVGNWSGNILVVDTRSGHVVDTIKTSDYPAIWNQVKNRPQLPVTYLTVTDDASLVAYGIEYTSGVHMIEYPSKRLLDSAEMGIGSDASSWPTYMYLSPKGTYFVMFTAAINRKTGQKWEIPQQQFKVHIDTAETKFAYQYLAERNGIFYSYFIAVQDLTDTSKAPYMPEVWGWPTLSADGTKLLSASYCSSSNGQVQPAKATVTDLQSQQMLWELYGIVRDTQTEKIFDFVHSGWNKDATQFLGTWSSTTLPANLRGRLCLWDVGQQQPKAVVTDAFPIYYRTLFDSDLSSGYTVNESRLIAVDLTKSSTDVFDNERASGAVNMYPNPASDVVHVSCQGEAASWSLATMDGRIELTGQEIEYSPTSTGASAFSVSLPAQLAPGAYVLTVSSASRQMIGRALVIKQ